MGKVESRLWMFAILHLFLLDEKRTWSFIRTNWNSLYPEILTVYPFSMFGWSQTRSVVLEKNSKMWKWKHLIRKTSLSFNSGKVKANSNIAAKDAWIIVCQREFLVLANRAVHTTQWTILIHSSYSLFSPVLLNIHVHL